MTDEVVSVGHRAACGSHLRIAIIAGCTAGSVATVAQVGMWWLAALPVTELFLRDVRLTAAIVMGDGILSSTAAARWDFLLAATCIHFVLATAYALIPACFSRRLRTWPGLFAGACYGAAIYAVNLFGFALVFPWFVVARDGITLLAHIVFGVTLAASCQLLTRWRRPQP